MTLSAGALRTFCALAGILAAILSWKVLTDVASNLPDRVRLLAIEIGPDKSGPVLLGRPELVQPPGGPTAERHLAIERRDSGIVVYDIAPDRRVGYSIVGGAYTDTNEVAIPEGSSMLHIGGTTWNAERTGTRLVLSRGPTATKVTLTPGGLRLQYRTFTYTTSTPWIDYAGSLVRAPSLSYHLGGDVSDGRVATALAALQIPDDRLPMDAARLRYGVNGWVLARGRLPVAVETASGKRDAEARGIPLVDDSGRLLVRTLTIGRTRYSVSYSAAEGSLRLTPISRLAWISAEDVVPPPDGAPITREDAPPQKRLDPDRLGRAALLAVACAAVIWLLTAHMRLHGARAMGVASAGLWLAAMRYDPSLASLGRVVGIALVIVGIFAIIFARPLPSRWRAVPIVFVLLGAGIFGGVTLLSPLDANPATRLETALAGAWLALMAPFVAPALTAAAALFWALIVPVSTFGAVAGVRLAVLEPTERWIALLDNHLIALAAIGLAATLILGIAHEGGSPATKRALLPLRQSMLAKLAKFMLGVALISVTLIGDNTGFFGIFQPSELAKTILVLLVAGTLFGDLARRTMLTAAEGALDLWTPFVAVGIAFAMLVVSAVNYDMSPILVSGLAILAALIAGTALHTAQLGRRSTVRRFRGLPVPRAPRRMTLLSPELSPELFWRVARRELSLRSSLWPVGLLSVVCLGLAAVAAWIVMHPSFQEGGPSPTARWLITPWKRAQSWYDMVLAGGPGLINFPETGQQLRLAREALLDAHCSHFRVLCPADAPMSLAPEAEAALLRVPTIQDDFAAVSLIHALGIDGALLYASAQAGLVAAALGIGLTALFSRCDFQLGAWLTGCAAIGMAVLVAAQIVLAWGNVLGFSPIMGQPMTFASFGASHHLGLALPFAVLVLLATLVASPRLSVQGDIRVGLYRHRVTQ